MDHIREFTIQGYRVQLDLSDQILGFDVPEQEFWSGDETDLSPTIPHHLGTEFVSAAALALKAKQFDDGLYAAVERAAQNGAGPYPGKAFLVASLATKFCVGAREPTSLHSLLFAACQLSGVDAVVPPGLAPAVSEAVARFLSDELRSKPLGFYTWSRDLEAIFRQDRILHGELRDEREVSTLVRVLLADDRLREVYVGYLDLLAALTNPLTESDLRPLLAAPDRDLIETRRTPVWFFPPSRAHETDLVMKLYGDRPVPEGFNLMDELIARIRSGDIQIKPTEESGWHDYQTWSIEPLAIPESMPESKHLRLDKSYRKHLFELFKGIHALTRETHIRPLAIACPPLCAFEPLARTLYIAPDLSAEPLTTFYQRRALSYLFVRKVLTATFGTDGLHQMNRLRPAGPVSLSLAEELQQMEALFLGAYATVSRQLGLDVEDCPTVGSGQGPEADSARFREWTRQLETDEDLGQDARMMVPVFYDELRRKTKVWLFLGWTTKLLRVCFAKPPRVLGDTKPRFGFGAISKLWPRRVQTQDTREPRADIVFTEAHRQLACPVTAEVYVTKILNRDEFRSHCDAYKTHSAILENLQ